MVRIRGCVAGAGLGGGLRGGGGRGSGEGFDLAAALVVVVRFAAESGVFFGLPSSLGRGVIENNVSTDG